MAYTKKYWDYQKNIGSNSYHSNYVKIKFQKHISGNLIQHCGFEIINVKVTKVIQPPYANIIYKFLGINGYVFFGKIYRFIRYLLSPFKTIGVSADIIIEAFKK